MLFMKEGFPHCTSASSLALITASLNLITLTPGLCNTMTGGDMCVPPTLIIVQVKADLSHREETPVRVSLRNPKEELSRTADANSDMNLDSSNVSVFPALIAT